MFGGDANPFLHYSEGKPRNPFASIIQIIVVALAINLTIYFLFILPSQVDGPSMFPTLVDKELLFANKIPTWAGTTPLGQQYNLDFHKGEIIIFEFNNILLVKRIIAVQGDKVKILKGKVYVNENLLHESYLDSTISTDFPSEEHIWFKEGETILVPNDSYFVLGDNRPASKDSRYSDVGFVKRSQMKGAVFVRIWPLNKFTFIGRAQYN